ncbi:hypothetical protein EJB05_15686, partial [Eragrostis curvula]
MAVETQDAAGCSSARKASAARRTSASTAAIGEVSQEEEEDLARDMEAWDAGATATRGVEARAKAAARDDSMAPSPARLPAMRVVLATAERNGILDCWSQSHALPATLGWVISNSTCPADGVAPECRSVKSYCQNTTVGRSGYTCYCSSGYQGNPYVAAGCKVA